MPYLTVRPQRTATLAPFAPRSAPAPHASARPRRRSPLVGGLTLPASRVLHSFSPSRRLPALPPRFQGTRGFRPPVCAAPYPPGRGATSSLLLSNIFIQLLWRRCLGGDSARRRGVTDVSPSRWVASLQSSPLLDPLHRDVLRASYSRCPLVFWQRALSWRAALCPLVPAGRVRFRDVISEHGSLSKVTAQRAQPTGGCSS